MTEQSWSLTWPAAEAGRALREESLLALADGCLGWRGNYEEGCAEGFPQTRGCYLNGFFEQEPIRYGEIAYGYAENSQTMLNVTDGQLIRLAVNGAALRFGGPESLACRRTLDLRAGTLSRETVYRVPGGELTLNARRLVSLTNPGVAAIRWTLRPTARCRVVVEPALDGAVTNRPLGSDPRIGSGLKGQVLSEAEFRWEGSLLTAAQHTPKSRLAMCCAMTAAVRWENGDVPEGARWQEGQAAGLRWELDVEAGETLTLTKVAAYCWDRDAAADRLRRDAAAHALEAAGLGFDALAEKQRECLGRFWERVGLEITGDDELLRGLRFNLFHIFQSAGRDGRVNMAAKGLTGEGYEGHYFWDSETYILPFLDSADPETARQMLRWRCAILPLARERARVMGQEEGALYPWRTIDGHEASAYYPAGTAQIHINGDIAMAVRRYVWMTGDLDFLYHQAAEMLCEICRYYLRYGFFDPEKGGSFCLNGVTGPDEYNALVNNNAYTNLVAAETLLWTGRVLERMAEEDPAALKQLTAAIGLAPEEPQRWRQAAERIHVPRKAGTALIWQDDAFGSRVPWPLESIPKENFPLLLHYHPLEIYRRRVCKQADLVLAMLLLPERFTQEEKRVAFEYYDPVTTHDSSLSYAAFSAMASRVGEDEKAFRYFRGTALLDLEDTHGNTSDGLHMANMAGSWFSLAIGFGGLEILRDGFRLSPVLPGKLAGYGFSLHVRNRLFAVRVNREGASCVQLGGESAEIRQHGGGISVRFPEPPMP